MAEPIVSETCPWPVTYADCGGPSCSAYEQWEEGDDRAQAQAIFEAIASDLLWNWTGRRFGVCPTTIRPCREGCGGPSPASTFWGRGPGYDPTFPRAGAGVSAGGWTPVLVGGAWTNIMCGCGGSCNCGVDGARSLVLPGPIASVSEVLIDGVVLDPAAYRVDENRWLVRTDGGVWPACQNLLAAPSEPDTFQVTYMRGTPVPVGGQVAVGRLACELALAACESGECALPERLQTITRQGVTVGFMDTFEDLQKGGTGIWSIDSWTTSVNAPRPFASVRSVDVHRGRR